MSDMPLRATAQAAQDACRDEGLCGEVSPDQQAICIKYEVHQGPHGWADQR